MKHFLIVLTCVFVSLIESISNGQDRNLYAPMYLGTLLIDQNSVDKMSSMCEQYNLSASGSQTDYKIFTHPDGTEILLKVDYIGGHNYPEVQIVTCSKMKEIDKMLIEAGYVKTSDGYVKGSKFEHRRTRCRISSGKSKVLTFTKEYNF